VSRPLTRATRAGVAAGLVLCLAAVPAQAAVGVRTDTPSPDTAAVADADPRAVSTPVEDDYYPAKGDPTVDALHYDLDLTWMRRSRQLRGVATIVLRTTRPDDVLRLDLSRRLEVGSVRVDGARTAFTHRGHHLDVAGPVGSDERHTLRVAYRGTPGPVRGPASRDDIARVGMRVTEDGQLWTMQQPFGAFTWYPVNDHPSDKAMYDVRVSAPGRWVGVSNGRLASRRTADGRTVTRWTNRDPMSSYLVTLAVGPYRAHRQTGPHDLPLTYWVPRGRPELVEPLRRTPAALRWLEPRLGRYPFEQLGIVVTPGGSAMETQTMVTFGRRNFGQGRFHVRSVIVHELAHHWWGDAVTPTQWRDLWMSEGMATYLHSRWEADHSGRVDTAWRWATREWADADPWYRHAYGPPGAYFPDEFASDNVYWSVALMWDRVRRRVGDDVFHRLVRAWPRSHRYRNASRDELVDWWQERSGVRLKPLVDRWLDSPASPA
jgi:aminopeptidase N